MRLIFDLEADGLLDTITKIHCIAVRDCDTGKAVLYGPDELHVGLDHMTKADELIGHNIIGYDLPALKKVMGWLPSTNTLQRDTLLWCQFLFSDLKSNDARSYDEDDEIDPGSHSLENWGKRLGCHKQDYQGGWETYTPEMGAYCLVDTAVCEAIRRHLVSQNRTDQKALEIEHQFARICQRMSERGIKFDLEKAQQLHDELEAQLAALEVEITADIPPVVTDMKTPAYWTVTWEDGASSHYLTKGQADADRKLRKVKPKQCTIEPGPMKQSIEPFNVGSRHQVRDMLWERFQWLSPALTEGGEKLVGQMSSEELAKQYGKLSEELLRECPHPLAQKIADYYLVSKIKSFLKSGDGDRGWLHLGKSGRIHGKIMTIGAATFRCTHSQPNNSQTPHVVSDRVTKQPVFGIAGRYGADCRQLYQASEGMVMVGADLSGIEAVMLAHFLWPHDSGAFAHQVLEGDIHAMNQKSILDRTGFPIGRSDVKTAFYGYAYSAGDMKLGQILVSTTSEAARSYADRRDYYRRQPNKIDKKVWSSILKARRTATPEEAALMEIGAGIRSALENGIIGLGDLMDRLKNAAKKGYINIFDRQVPVRNVRSVLNTLLQTSAALVMKKWVCLTDEWCIRDNVEYFPLLNIHDESDVECRPEFVEPYSALCKAGMKGSGDYYGIRLPVRGDIHVGKSWLEVH